MSDWLDPDRLEQQCRKARALRERFLAGDMGYGKRAQEPCGGPASPSAPPAQQPCGGLASPSGNCAKGADTQAVNRPYRAHPWAPELVLAGQGKAIGGPDDDPVDSLGQDCLERDAPHRLALLRVAPLPDGRGKR